MKYLFCFFLLLPALSIAEDDEYENRHFFSLPKEVRDDVRAIKNLSPEKYSAEIDSIRTKIEKHVAHKKMICSGSLSGALLGEKSSKADCVKELRALQITHVTNMFNARKSFLEFTYEQQIKEVSQQKDQTIATIKASIK